MMSEANYVQTAPFTEQDYVDLILKLEDTIDKLRIANNKISDALLRALNDGTMEVRDE